MHEFIAANAQRCIPGGWNRLAKQCRKASTSFNKHAFICSHCFALPFFALFCFELLRFDWLCLALLGFARLWLGSILPSLTSCSLLRNALCGFAFALAFEFAGAFPLP